MERPLLRLALAAIAAVLLASGCGGEQDAADGTALESSVRSTYSVTGVAALPPGRDASVMLTRLRNGSRSDVVIRSIEPFGLSGEAAGDPPAEVIGVELAVRNPVPAETVPLGFYPGERPALEIDGTCVEQPTVPAGGFLLKPRTETADEVYLVVHLRTAAPGTFLLEGQRVIYELDGVVYRQDFLDGLEIEVRDGADPEVPAEQAACVAR